MKEEKKCKCCVDDKIVEAVKKKMLSDNQIMRSAELFCVFADFTRLKIVNALLHSEMCVGDIALLTEMSHSAISHQLSVLKRAHIASVRNEGKVRYYKLSDEHIELLFKTAVEHINE